MSFILKVVSSEGVKTWMETHSYSGLKKQETNHWIWDDYCSWKEREKKSSTADIQKGKIPNSLLKYLVRNLNCICTWQIKRVQIRLKRVRRDWATSTQDLNRNSAAALYRGREILKCEYSYVNYLFFFNVLIYFITGSLYLAFVCQINAVSPKTTKGDTHYKG